MSEVQELGKKRFPYVITKTNWIIYAVACFVTIFMSLKEVNTVPEFIGHAIGYGFAYLIFASLFGVIFWFVLGRKQYGGSTTFNVLIIITFLGQLNEFTNYNTEKQIDTSELKIAINKYKEDLKNDSIPVEVAFQKFTTVLENNLDQYIEQSSGDQKELYIGLKGFIKEANVEVNNWLLAQSKINAKSFFDISILQKKENVASQIQKAKDFVVASKRYKVFIMNRKNTLNKIVKDKDIDDEFSQTLIDLIDQKVKNQNPLFVPFIDNYITYGNKIIVILEMIKDKEWSKTSDGYIEFKDAAIESKFNELIIELTAIEKKINDLNGKLINAI